MDKLLTLAVPGYGQIQAPGGVPTGGLTTSGSNLLQVGLTLLLVTAIVVALFMLIYSGIQWIMSQGDKAKVESARMRIIYSIIGLIVIFLSFMIVNVVGTFFGIKLLDFGNFGSNTGSDLGTYQNQDTNQNNNTQDNVNKTRRKQGNKPRKK